MIWEVGFVVGSAWSEFDDVVAAMVVKKQRGERGLGNLVVRKRECWSCICVNRRRFALCQFHNKTVHFFKY